VSESNSIVKMINEELGINLLGVLVFNGNEIVLANDVPVELMRLAASLINFINRVNGLEYAKVKLNNVLMYAVRSGDLIIVFLANPTLIEGALSLVNRYVDKLVKMSWEVLNKAKAIEPAVTVEGDELTEDDILILLDYFKGKLRELEAKGE
jgi:hypothetical protein